MCPLLYFYLRFLVSTSCIQLCLFANFIQPDHFSITMMYHFVTAGLLLAVAEGYSIPQDILAAVKSADSAQLVTDLSTISRYWGPLTPYSDNAPDLWGVQDTGIPAGCQIEQAHVLQRHANRFPSDSDSDNNQRFGEKVLDSASADAGTFTGPLEFLNTYHYEMSHGYLTGLGASTEFRAGVSFWNQYGRTLYNASVGQVAYEASFPNGTARPKPVLRTTSQSRIYDSGINWSLGFFGASYETLPNPNLTNASSPFEYVVIPEGGRVNNTLAAYDSCHNSNRVNPGFLGDLDQVSYIPKYLQNATARLQQYAPSGFTLNTNDTYAMQSICAFESGYLGRSDFCFLFTEEEWQGFEATSEIDYFFDVGFGQPTGRAQGIGYLQELMARLKHEYIPSSNSSVNSTYDSNPAQFPLDQAFYADFSHDVVIISVLTAMSLDYFHDAPSLTDVPPNSNRSFILSQITPFGARLVTEVIGCAASDPAPVADARVQYYPTQYGYDPENAPHKFIRMRLNDGILPLDTIRGGKCEGRSDGLCALDDFLESQAEAYDLSNYDYACFANYSLADPTSGKDYDGTISA